MSDRQSASDIDDDAAHWAWRMDCHEGSAELQSRLEAWLDGDTRRRGAFLRAQAALAMAGRTPGASTNIRQSRGIRAWFRDGHRAVAGGLSALVVALAVWLIVPDGYQRLQTSVGEIRQVPLGDGSTASINTHSRLAFIMKPDRRRVALEEGEAWFRVAKDPRRPFTVEVGRVRVRAIGTAFSVRRQEAGAEVLVTEGIVETWVEGAEGHTVRVTAGGKAFVAENAAISNEPAAAAEVERALAWRSGKIDFAGEDLAHAVAEFNRYNTRKLAVADEGLARERLYGVFRTDDPEGFAYAVRKSLGASVSFPNADEIRLEKENE